jgi:hypothetical protein
MKHLKKNVRLVDVSKAVGSNDVWLELTLDVVH